MKERRRQRGPGSAAERESADLEADVRALARRIATSRELDAPSVRTLQRTAGNQATLRHLGEGQPLDGRTRARMESAFGTSFAGVRTHTGPESAGLVRAQNAEAFAVGERIVLGDGYEPGTPMGDALLAHELAHVAQQRDARTMVQSKALGDAPESALEQDANRSALAAVSSLWGGVKANAMPALKSGVRLSKGCGSSKIQEMAKGTAGTVKSDDISIKIEKHERGTPGGKTSPMFVAEGTVTGVDSGIAEIYRLEGDNCNEESASPPDPIWKVPIVAGKFQIILPFSASTTPAWGHTFMIKAGDGTNYNTACEKVSAGK